MGPGECEPMSGDPNPFPSHVVQAYVDLRLAGVPQRDAAREVAILQPRAATWDKRFSLPTSRNPDRRPYYAPDWKGETAICPGCGHEFQKIDAGQRFCPDTRYRCGQYTRRRRAREARGA